MFYGNGSFQGKDYDLGHRTEGRRLIKVDGVIRSLLPASARKGEAAQKANLFGATSRRSSSFSLPSDNSIHSASCCSFLKKHLQNQS